MKAGSNLHNPQKKLPLKSPAILVLRVYMSERTSIIVEGA